MRLLFVIRSLDPGGAERQLVTLARNLDPREFSVTVMTCYSGGRLAEELRGTPHVRLVSADKRRRWDIAGFLWRVWKLVREVRPNAIHGYMPGTNELALLLARLVRARVVWGVRASELDLSHYDWTARLLCRTGAWLSHRADLVIANSEAGRRFHIGLGYPPQRFIVIPNGIDTDVYKPDDVGRQRVRAQWGVNADEVVIGIVARIDPMKDHETFLHAAASLVAAGRPARFVAIGAGNEESLARLKIVCERLHIAQRVIWAGARQDMTAVYSAIDIVTLSSAFGEGFSNTLAEAMACEAACVATDVGDARIVVGEAGEIVPPRDPDALAMAWHRMLEATPQARAERGRKARARIVQNFSVDNLVARTTDALHRLVPRQPFRRAN